MTPASSLWKQNGVGSWGQSASLVSLPKHCTSSIKILPCPRPKKAPRTATAPEKLKRRSIIFTALLLYNKFYIRDSLESITKHVLNFEVP